MTDERICGTRVEAAADDDRTRALILSDLHVQSSGDAPHAQLRRVLADAAGDASATRVLILGDLFDAYATPRQLAVGVWRDVAADLAGAARAGVSITILHGNRDFMLERRFAETSGARIVAGGLRLRLGRRRVLALHGDELLWNDVPYQRAKRWLRHPLTRGLLRAMPRWLALQLAERARRASRTSTTGAEPSRFAPVAPAVAAVFATGVDLLLFGHIHRPARGAFGDGAEYCILPAFDERGILLEARGDDLWYRDAEGTRQPDPAPREFPAPDQPPAFLREAPR